MECSHFGRCRLLIVRASRMPIVPPMSALVAEIAIELTNPSR